MKILIADDHAIVRQGVMELLRTEFVSTEIHEASHGGEALDKIKDGIWDIILLDISMPVKNGIETLKQLRAKGIKAPVLMLSMQPEDQYALRALKAGASGFVNKASATDELISAVHVVLSGRKYISAGLTKRLGIVHDASGSFSHEDLSDREMQVLQLIASGKTVTEIAVEVSLGITTISTYRAHILEKLQLTTNAELVRYAVSNGLV
ncbi:MAG: response regulator transcription factor [Bacteroidota bacterium]|nr:response regulator transcription factor [Bacteroidota bacterium]